MAMTPRLDVLLYAHDGRGLGHISRSVAIGLSIRRLFPELRIAVITGSPFGQMLAGQFPLEIIKLPSYEVTVHGGESRGAKSNINYSDQQLARLRSGLIAEVVSQTRPRCILVDHLPLGKREELRKTRRSVSQDCVWILGIRAVLGNVAQIRAVRRNTSVLDLYTQAFWYGVSKVTPLEQALGQMPRNLLVEEMGYISRAYELEKWGALCCPVRDRSGCIVSFSWLTEHTVHALRALADLAERVGRQWGDWTVFLGRDYTGGLASEVVSRMINMPHCTVEVLSGRYLRLLATSSFAVVAGGYNTLTDLLWSRTPGVLLRRSMADKEQNTHILRLCATCDGEILSLQEGGVTVSSLKAAIKNVVKRRKCSMSIGVSGSEVVATRIAQILKVSHGKSTS